MGAFFIVEKRTKSSFQLKLKRISLQPEKHE